MSQDVSVLALSKVHCNVKDPDIYWNPTSVTLKHNMQKGNTPTRSSGLLDLMLCTQPRWGRHLFSLWNLPNRATNGIISFNSDMDRLAFHLINWPPRVVKFIKGEMPDTNMVPLPGPTRTPVR
jgi:hypothetical protein